MRPTLDALSPPTPAALARARHLIVPFAHADDPACRAALAGTALLQLGALLARWHPVARHDADAYTLTPPHEHALAQALGWPAAADGTHPWAAWRAGVANRPCAWFTPCHWQVGMEQVALVPPEALDLRPDESAALLQALAPYAREDGLDLQLETPQRWRAEGESLRGLPCASLDRVAHRRVDAWLPHAGQAPQVAALLRLQNEAQMLFYTHPVNDVRQARGALPLNGFWISGAGAWPGTPDPGDTQVLDALRPAALQGDWAAWAQAWRALDAEVLTPWLQGARADRPLTLTLCGERGWVRYTSAPAPAAPRPWWQALNPWRGRRAAAPSPATVLATL
ncbi:hypothetical protein [Aquabacterium sp. A08]|uniref:hypothetical protein n=1 Tax=Aquabacterium sp. A08 TaxID=2718532 RepID=UPI0014218D30|nr:hypothetical protein [Aquabacterium sp. A08]NIC40301.1 hypothetical protein [Aquabacterium sp. A08]